MLNQYKRKRDEGFTIIEVMIVLAIAGLIMLIVFLAVPALQRSSRNTQRTQDVGTIGTAAQDVISNNNGTLSSLTTATLAADLTNLAYYQTSAITVAAGPAAVTNGTTPDTVVVYTGAKCASMAGGMGATNSGALSRQLAIVYTVEAGSSNNKNCKDL